MSGFFFGDAVLLYFEKATRVTLRGLQEPRFHIYTLDKAASGEVSGTRDHITGPSEKVTMQKTQEFLDFSKSKEPS